MSEINIYFDGGSLTITPHQQPSFSSRVTSEDLSLWKNWLSGYEAIRNNPALEQTPLRELGQQLFTWLNRRRSGWLKQFVQESSELIFRLAVIPRPSAHAEEAVRAFIDVPWALLAATADRFLVEEPHFSLVVLRYLGRPTSPLDPGPYRLGMVFMAAAPEDQPSLNYEAEESGILTATEAMGIDLFVEESGTLEGLGSLIRKIPFVPQVLHLSCHGMPGALCFETEDFETMKVSALDLKHEITPELPRLVFLSACSSSDFSETHLGAFSRGLVGQAGVKSVIAWSGSVGDAAATAFAMSFYKALSSRSNIAKSLILGQQSLRDHPKYARDWHRVRVLLAPDGDGSLVGAGDARMPFGYHVGTKEYLDKGEDQIPVASRLEFVGRRRELRTVLRDARHRQFPGALLHGVGCIGKSSLANRVAHRLFDFRKVVMFQSWNVKQLIESLKLKYPNSQRLQQEPGERYEALLSFFREFLKEEAHGRTQTAPPLLLILDDFENALNHPESDELPVVNSVMAPVIAALLQAFSGDQGRSFLIVTTRFQFRLDWDGDDLGDILKPVSLMPMTRIEQRKQIRAKLAVTRQTPEGLNTEKVLLLSRGVPGLQDRILSIWLEENERFQQVADQIQMFWDQGNEQGEIADFLEQIMLPTILGWLSDQERHVLTLLNAVHIPLPSSLVGDILQCFGLDTSGGDRIDRLKGLGLVNSVTDGYQKEQLFLSPLVRPKSGMPSRADLRLLAIEIWNRASSHWEFNENMPGRVALLITRIGLTRWCGRKLAANPLPLKALAYLLHENEFRKAGRLAQLIKQAHADELRTSELPLLRRLLSAFRRSQALAEEEDVDQAVCTIEADIRLPHLTEWLHSNATRVHYLSRVQTEIGLMVDGCQLLATAQHLEKMEVFYLVLERLQTLLEHHLDEE